MWSSTLLLCLCARQLNPDFVLQVNISANLYEETLKLFEKCPPGLFHRAQVEVFNLMGMDSLPKFAHSEEFKQYLADKPHAAATSP